MSISGNEEEESKEDLFHSSIQTFGTTCQTVPSRPYSQKEEDKDEEGEEEEEDEECRRVISLTIRRSMKKEDGRIPNLVVRKTYKSFKPFKSKAKEEAI